MQKSLSMHPETPAYTRMQPLALASFLILKNSGSSFADGRDHLFADRCVKVVDRARRKLIPHFCMNVCETQDTEARSTRACVRAETERSYYDICVSFFSLYQHTHREEHGDLVVAVGDHALALLQPLHHAQRQDALQHLRDLGSGAGAREGEGEGEGEDG